MTHAAAAVDGQGMLATVEQTPQQWADGLALATARADMAVPRGARAVLVAGMGGSGVAADAAQALAGLDGTCPVVPVKHYRLPAWAGPRTPLIAVSYSGDTEETLAAVADADGRGCPVLAVTSGGRLGELAAERSAPAVVLPGGWQPRAALALLIAPVLVALDRAGVLPGMTEDLTLVPDHLRRVRAGWADEPARLAQHLRGRIPVFLGGHGIGAVVARRGKCQVNENAEMPAFANELPELDHNEVMGWGGGPPAPYTAVELHDPGDHERVVRRFAATRDVTAEVLSTAASFVLAGHRPVERLACGMLLVDLLSVELALATGTDPTPVERIGRVKRRLAEMP